MDKPPAASKDTAPPKGNVDEPSDGGLLTQLEALYAERERLHSALGTADSGAILAMVQSLRSQLESVYEDRFNRFCAGQDNESESA